jgi:hypothetical protein
LHREGLAEGIVQLKAICMATEHLQLRTRDEFFPVVPCNTLSIEEVREKFLMQGNPVYILALSNR